MLKPQQRSDFLRHESLPVFGKPWYWQRNSGTMESTRSLAQVVMEMRDEIKKLETENRALRGELGQQAFGTVPGEPGPGSFGTVPGEPGPGSLTVEQRTGMEENPYVNLRRNVSAPALEGQYKENIVMTVRRYSISSSHLPGGESRREGGTGGESRREGGTGVRDGEERRGSDSSWGRLQDEVQRGSATSIFGDSAKDEMETITNRHSLQEFVHKNRAKVKTVTFLLPVDDIYTNRPVLTRHLEDHNTTQLDSIAETDS